MKKCITDLAQFGGAPAFREPLHVGRPNIGDRARLTERFDRILDNRWLTNAGPFVREFEQRLQDVTGARHCIAICNGTVALEIAIRALDLRGEVIVPSFTFVATVHALQWQAITPVFCDIDPVRHTLDPACVEALITPRTSGIIGVHLWGQACGVDRLEAIARGRNLRLMFDAAHAFGCSCGGRMVGNFGEAEVYSFHATKFINTFEGGAIATNSDELAAKIRLIKNFGFSGRYDEVLYLGTNGKMNEFSAAMGVTSLESMPEFIAACRLNYHRYRKHLEGMPGVRLLRYDEREKNNYQYVALEIDAAQFGLSRDQIVTLLHAENVLARRYFYPGCHRMEPYRTLYPDAAASLPVTEQICGRMLVLPTGTAVNEEAVDTICDVLRLCTQEAKGIRAQWP